MYDFEFFDKELALSLCGGNESLLNDIYNLYFRQGLSNLKEFPRLLEEDMEQFVILVHALKNTTKNIGVVDFSEFAKKMEFAGRDGNYALIREEYDDFIKQYKTVLRKVADVVGADPASIDDGVVRNDYIIIVLDSDSDFLKTVQSDLSHMGRVVPMKTKDMISRFLTSNKADIILSTSEINDDEFHVHSMQIDRFYLTDELEKSIRDAV